MATAPENLLYSPASKPEAKSKQYRSSAYSVREFARLPHAQQMMVDAECQAKEVERKKSQPK